MKHRRLTVDPLEERVLLSVVPADYDDVLVNEIVGTSLQTSIAAQSVAVDHDGDFVVVWERFDEVLRPDPSNPGQMIPVIDPATGDPMLDANVYARYFTDEVQRLTLPRAIADDADGNNVAGSFSLTYGGNEVQKISITATYPPATMYARSNIAGAVTFGFDVNDNGIVGPGETTTVFFNEGTQEFTEIAADFQTHLQGLGGALTDVTVRGMNPHEYIVEFGDLSMGLNQPEITVESVNFTSGFLPAVITSTVREPIVIGPIFVSANNPEQTANAIEEAFFLTSNNFVMGPVNFPPSEGSRVDIPEGPYRYPDVLRTAAPGVSVTPVWEQVYDSLGNPVLDANGKPLVAPSTTVFDITFDGSNGAKEGPAGKQDHPLLVVSSAAHENGTSLLPSTEVDVETLKEPSPEFRVNPSEPDNPFTQLPDRYNQRRPDVAMDADGEFIITWESVVPNVVQYGTVADVFARRFAPVGIVPAGEEEFHVDTDFDGIADTPIQGVKALDSGFRVNTTTTGAQGQPAVGMDDEGNFVIAWGSGTEGFTQFDPYQVFQGQDLGYFNGVRAQRFDRFGEPVGDEFLVDAEDTEIHFEPYVALSHDGHSIITWSNTNDENFVQDDGYTVGILAKVFNPDGTVRRNQFAVAGGGGSAAAFDDNNNYAITWAVNADSDNVGSGSTGVRAVMYDINGAVIRSTFRVNSASFTPGSNTIWPSGQYQSELALDADGEMVVTYEGFGPDVSEDLGVFGSYRPDAVQRQNAYRQALIARFSKPENADLLPFFNPATESFPITSSYFDATGNYVFLGSTYDIDTDIENVLIRAKTRTSPGATDAQLGRLRALIEEVAGLLEGEANGVMFTSLDADPNFNNSNILQSDNVANNERDGHTQRYILTIPTTSTGGSFQIRVSGPFTGGYDDRTINPVYNNQILDIGQTRTEIENELQASVHTGRHWDSTAPPTSQTQQFEQSVEVRIVSTGFGSNSSEVTARENTPWEYTVSPDEAVYEIVVQGEIHNEWLSMGLRQIQLQPTGTTPRLFLINYPDEGTTQTSASIGMEQDGDFVMVWTQNEEFTTGGVSNQNIYYRRFTEPTDTAGPKVTDLVNQYDQGMADDDLVVGPVQYVVLTFDEEMMTGDPLANPDSVLNPNNFILYRGDQEIPFGVAKVEFGMNKATDLAGTDDGFGGTYPSTWTASNKWEAVLVLDADGGLVAGLPSLGTGRYTVQARAPRPEDGISGLRDKAGNALGFSGFRVAGQNSQRSFVVTLADPDVPISKDYTTAVAGADYLHGTTHPETPGAVAVDSDGQYVVVWTGNFDPDGNPNNGDEYDRVFMRLFDADGTPADLMRLDTSGNPTGVIVPDSAPVLPVTPFDSIQSGIAQKFAEFDGDVQRHANVAIDRDGDIVVTWTNYADGNLDDADIYARRFDSVGDLKGIMRLFSVDFPWYKVTAHDAFLVNSYTDDAQKWSDVAMDLDGDFVVTWSSYGQEAAEGDLGTGWGIYARQYDAFGQPLAPEFRVNITTAGNQQGSSVAMSGEGDFVVAWTSDQNGIGDDIIAREFYADGSPKVSPLVGEIVVNDTQVGDQRFPDVAMRLDGENYVVTWTDSAADKSGASVWAELSRPLPNRYVDPNGYAINATHRFTINVRDNLTISDVNIQLGILTHQRLEDLRITLESPAGTQVRLFEDLPRPFPDGSRPPGNSMVGTLIDDEAQKAIDITDSAGGAVPPYNDSFVPEQRLDAFIGEGTQGVWTLIVEDRQPQNNLVGSLVPLSAEIGSWSLIIEASDDSADSFLVNTTREGHQMFSSAAMDNDGAFAITWSGHGNQQFQEDTSGHGVFYQRYDEFGVALGLEQRANSPQNIEGNQWISSISMDASGNAVIAWTGPQLDAGGNPLAETDIYTFVSVNDAAQLDDDGPLVTDLLWNGERVLQGDVLDTLQNGVPVEVTELTVVFSEDMSLATTPAGDPDLISIENPNSWVLTRNGSEIIGGVTDVDFAYNEVTRRYEAVVSIDGNGISSGTPGLPDGEYVLAIKDDMTDVSVFFDPNEPDRLVPGNRLDGDADGQPASSPTTLGYSAYLHRFVVGGGPANGPEFRVNSDDYVQYQQTFSEPAGTGLAREESTRSVAVDHDGDYVVVWTSYGQTPGEPADGDVYFAMFDRYDNPITKHPVTGEVLERRVNTFTTGDQRNAAVAMDADGEFVIVWESEGQDPDQSWGIYARRYDSMGRPLVSDVNRNGVIDSGDNDLPFRVNTGFTRNQLNPSVAMDDFGGFVVVWATAGQDFSFFNDVYAQRYSRFGVAQGLELLVNTFDLPGVQPPPGGSFEINPAVGMSGPSGNFVVAWDVVTAQQNGVVTNSVVAARRFAADGSPQGAEFQADTGPGTGGGDIFRVARNPQVAVDDLSGFIVVWESYMGNPVAAYDVFFRQFNSGGGSIASGQVNMPETLEAGEFADDQVNPSVAIDADGDFAVVWNGQGAQPDPLNPNNPDLIADDDIEGVFIRQYHAAGDSNGDGIPDLPPAPVTVQSRVNRTESGIQQFPSIGMEPDGDMIVVWSGRGVGDVHGIFARRYDEQTDTAGPLATELRTVDGELVQDDAARPIDITNDDNKLIVVFDENMWTSGDDSVTNADSWVLERYGIVQADAIANIDFGLNPGTNKWEAELQFASDLTTGKYTLIMMHPVPDDPGTSTDEGQTGLRDAVGNPLASSGLLPGGEDMSFGFFVSPEGGQDVSVTSDVASARTYAEAKSATAMDFDGDYVVAYTVTSGQYDKVYVRLFDVDGQPVGNAFPVTTSAGFTTDHQRYANVDLDADGDFVVTWTNYRSGDADVYTRVFSANGDPMGAAFRVNSYTEGAQKWSDVALDPDGDFVVTWSSYGQEGSGMGYGIYGRRFSRFAKALGAETHVNTTIGGNQRFSAVDVADTGTIVVAWTSSQNGVGDDIVARLFNSDGSPGTGPLSGELVVNRYEARVTTGDPGSTSGNQRYPDVAIMPTGDDFMVTWTSSEGDGSGNGAFARTVNVPLLNEQAADVMLYASEDVPQDFGYGNTVVSELDVPFDVPPNNFTIADVNVIVNVRHPRTGHVEITLVSPAGTSVKLVENEPDVWAISSDFIDTVFDDESPIAITDDSESGPYINPLGYQPEGLVTSGPDFGLDAFDGQRSSGTWLLVVQDTVWGDVNLDGIDDDTGTLNSWSLELTRTPAVGPVIQVNESTLSNQQHSSVTATRQGTFTVAWSGRGDQTGQEDADGGGVFFRQFKLDGTPLTDETRANFTTDGSQGYVSVGSDAVGNFSVVWTGDVPGMAGVTDVYQALGSNFVGYRDLDGPVVTDVLLPNGDPLLSGDAFDEGLGMTELIVIFSEDLSIRDDDVGPDSVLNPDNWTLERNGIEITGLIEKISFDLNPVTRKYEAVLSLNASGIGDGTASLPDGSYELTVRDTIKDSYDYDPEDDYSAGNALDGDFDGTPGTSAGGTGFAGYRFEFTVLKGSGSGVEYQVNDSANDSLQQTSSEPLGTGYGREQSTTSLAVDHDGDYVAVWTSYGQDDPSDFNGGGIYFRMFNRDDQEIQGETLVNTVTDGSQRNAAVAMDADGDFVIVWESEGDNVDGSWGVYGRMYNSVGDPLGDQFLINTTLQNDQLNPSVAMDDFGNFAVVWAAKGQQFSYFNDVVGQLFNYDGDTIGSEFVINSTGVPGTGTGPGNVDLNPAVAMDDLGNFVVAWDQITAQQSGVITDSEIRARIYDDAGAAAGAEFVVGSGVGEPGGQDIGRTARNPQLAMQDAHDADADGQVDPGGFIVVWESTISEQYDIFYEQFDYAGTSLSSDQVNASAPLVPDPDDEVELALARLYGGEQVNASVGIDADGDFVVTWNGRGARPDGLYPNDPDFASEDDNEGVFIRSYQSTETAPEPVTVQSRVNKTESGIQQFATIGMEPDGDRVVVWSGNGIGDRNGVFARRYNEATDTAGPKVSDITTIYGERIGYGGQLTEAPNYIVVVFDEEMKAGNPALVADSVLNPANYSLVKDGAVLVGGIRSVQFDLNKASKMFPGVEETNKWEAVIELDGNGTGAGLTALPAGQYEIIISGTLRDVVGNPLYSSGLNPYGEDASGRFNVVGFTSTTEQPVNGAIGGDQVLVGNTGAEYAPRAVASDGDGEFVVVWTDATSGGVYARVYNDLRWSGTAMQRISTGPIPDDAFQVTDKPSAMFASVARDADGDFVVTWEQNDGTAASPNWNVWARRYDAVGRPFGKAFLVNSVTEGQQRYAAVAIDVDGDFVVTWQSNDAAADLEGRARDDDGYGIYAQRFSPSGQRLGGADEVQVLTFSRSPVGTFTLFWDGDDNPSTANVTAPIRIDGNPAGSVDQIEAQLNVLAGDVNRVQVQATSLTEVIIYFVDQGAARNQKQIVVSNTSFLDPVSDVAASTLIEGFGGEFLVNDTTVNNQMHPSIAMSAEGDFVISWTSFGQDGDAANQSNIYAKKFASNDAFRYPANAAGVRDYDYNARVQYPDAYFAVSTDNPDNHIVNPASGYDGVVMLTDVLTGGSGTGSLLRTGRHILTAAHVVDIGGGIPTPMMLVQFDTPNGPTFMTATEIYIHPGWNGDILNANDLAILVLPDDAPAEAERYDIYRSGDELNQRVEMVGYGVAGQGAEQFFDGQKRIEWNEYEAYGDDLNGLSMLDFLLGIGSFDVPAGRLLVYDFDSGLRANDALGMVLGIGDLGLGEEEGTSSHGDSGGPAFINGLIAGVVSGGSEYLPADSDTISFNVSFGTVGFHTRVSAYADWIDMITQSTTGEFLVNDVPLDPVTGAALATGNQKWSSVAMDADGDFAITWTDELRAPDPNEHLNVMAKRFNADATEFEVTDPTTGLPAPLGEFQVNTAGDASRSQAAMDADGDFVIVWGNKAQRYAKNDRVGDLSLGPNGELGGNLTVFTGGPGLYASVAMDHTGDTVFVREGYDSLNPMSLGIFYKRSEAAEDDAGPMVADVINVIPTGTKVALQQLTDGVVVDERPTTLIVSFSEDLIDASPSLIDSIKNRSNWILTRNGQVLAGGVAAVEFGLNQTSSSPFPILPEETNKYEAVLTLDGDPSDPGNQPLGPGTYVLRIRNFVEDQFNNRLDGNYDGAPDGDFRRTFVVSPEAGGPALDGDRSRIGDADPNFPDELVNFNPAGDQYNPAVASDADGNYVVAWVETADVLDATGAVIGTDSNIKARRYDRFGNPIGGEFIVNSYRTGEQLEPAVAMNAFGSFVVTWSGEGEVDDLGTIERVGIFGRVFDAFGQPLAEQFRVNQSGDARKYGQTVPSVAMDDRGDFAVTWTSYGQDGDQDGVYARRYDYLGEAKGDEFPVNLTVLNRQANSDIAMDEDGNFAIVWSAFEQPGDGSEWAVVGRRYNAAGTPLSGEFLVNTYKLDDQTDAHVGMDAEGNFVVAWASDIQDGSGWGVYARRYGAGGGAAGSSFRVNQTTLYWQYQPDVSMAQDGDFVVTWTTVGQDNPDAEDRGIYARAYDALGNDYVDPDTGLVVGEFQVNANVIGNQATSAVALDADGDFAVVWTGPDADANGVYHRHFRVNDVSGGTGGGAITGSIGGVYFADGSSGGTSTVLSLQGTPGDDTFEFRAGPTAATSVVVVNGVRYTVRPEVLSIRFDGQGGHDEVVIKGSALDETIDLYPDHAAFSASRYNVSVANVEWIFALGGGGTDFAILHDDPAGKDTLKAWPGIAKLYGDGFYTIAKSFSHVLAYATAGSGDMAILYDDPHSVDTFKAWPTEAKLYGDGFYNKVGSFDSVYAYATANGGDMAILYDDPDGKDTFKAWPTEAKLYGDGFFNRASSFSSVYAYATKGKGDLAVLYDDPNGVDTFKAWPNEAKLYANGGRFFNRAKGFDSVYGYATKDGGDLAILYDAPGVPDTFKAWPSEAKLYGTGFYSKANGFSSVHAYATEGDKDTAVLYDDPSGQDTLKAWPNEAKLYGGGFFNRAKGFYSVYAYATPGGNDVARLYDSPSKDTLVATPESVRLYNGVYYNRASSFANVYAYSTNEGDDTAYLNDSALEESPDHLEADANWARLSNGLLGYAYLVSDFEEVVARQSNASDTEDVDTAALDFLFSTERTW